MKSQTNECTVCESITFGELEITSTALKGKHLMISPKLPRAQHINFGRSHPPRKIIPKCPFGIPRMNFPELPGSAFLLAFLYYWIGNPEFPGIFRYFPGEGFWGPQIGFSGEDGVDMLGSGEPKLSTRLAIILGLLWCFLGSLLPVLVFTGAAPRRVSTSSGNKSVYQSMLAYIAHLWHRNCW